MGGDVLWSGTGWQVINLFKHLVWEGDFDRCGVAGRF
jgi:hypothetical protein